MNDIFLKPYNPVETEDRIYDSWEKSGYFDYEKLPKRYADGQPFSIVLPPPNVTGTLHMGSALMLAIEDIMVRYARMTGKRTMWIPGTDHAAIATQSKVEKEISKKEGKSRHDLGREELLRRIDIFAKESHDVIVKQVRKMGCSIDWSREAFTLDEKRNLAVRTVFKKMFDDGIIYRGFRVVNWDPKGQTTISDDEIVYETRKTKLYTFKYSKDIPISISTTRPETKLGDTAIAVHPDDARFAKYIGKEFSTVFAGEPIHLKVISDISVEKDFGTGALGVTPAHSAIDWEMSQKNNLPLKQVINEYGKMMVGNDSIMGKKTAEAREAVVEWLRAEGLLEKEEDIEHNIALAERTGGVVEPLPKLQWFVGVNKKFRAQKGKFAGKEVTLKELMHDAVESGDTKMIPDRFEKTYIHWIDNLRDWCISRQIWYGHRVPVWYREVESEKLKEESGKWKAESEKLEIYCDINPPKGEGWKQDEDTLDTWFSSGLWTFSTLGWPDEKEFSKYKEFHPNTILETGWDILPFWVARMILMSTYVLGEVPFKSVYLHGLVRDAQGRKISKSLGNNVEPLDMIAKYGADAVRVSLIIGVGPGNDSKIGEDKIKAYKLFANKLWNITRFILSGTEGCNYDVGFDKSTEKDLALKEEFSAILKDITSDMENFRYYLAGDKLYQYAWHRLADVLLEESKAILSSGIIANGAPESPEKTSRQQFLLDTLIKLVRALHPFMPYITEEIWAYLPGVGGSAEKSGKDVKELLMVSEWPL